MSGEKVIVTGARGQDGTLLRRLLVNRGIDVVGVDRPRAASAGDKDKGVLETDLGDEGSVETMILGIKPDRIFHLAACHHSSERVVDHNRDREMVRTNFQTSEILLSAIARHRPSCRILFAGSSQMYTPQAGKTTAIREDSAMAPTSFYGATKAWTRSLLTHYREKRGIHALMAILFNHESPLRAPQFLARKVSIAAARAKCGLPASLRIRDIESRADWSNAHDIVQGLQLALDASDPADYVLASGILTGVEDILKAAFGFVGLDWREFTILEPTQSSITTRGFLIGNIERARGLLGWKSSPEFRKVMQEMVRADMQLIGGPECD